MTLTRTTPAAVFNGPGMPFEFRAVAVPEPRGEEILVAVAACTLCGSDLHSVRGKRAVPLPTILGHEVLGRIAALGPEAPRRDATGQPLALGDRVTWSIVASCNECFYCLRGLPQKCLRQTKYGHEALRPGHELTGGLAGHCLLAPGTAVFRVPESLPDARACPANCATATVAAALEAGGPLASRNVLVLGAGMLGLTAAAWARTEGASEVIACDTEGDRRDLAATFGASRSAAPEDLAQVVLDATDGHGVDAAFEMTGSPEALEAALPLVRMGGSLVLVGAVFPSRPVPLAPEQVVRRCLTLRGVHNYAPRHLQAALGFLEANRQYPFERLVARWRPLDELDSTLAEPPASGTLRIGIRPA